jgi:Spy/CpxP family protein refolding chaperone
MKRWWLPIALVLSLGVNVGILATLALRRPAPAADSSPDVSDPAPEFGEFRQPPPFERGGPGWGRDPGGGEFGEGGPGAMLGRLVERLGLEGEERQRFIAIQRQFFERQGALRRQLGDVQGALRREVAAAEPDPAKLEEILTRLHQLHFERDRLWIQSILESRKVLDPRQERLYMGFLASVTRRAFGDRRHGGPGGGPGGGGRGAEEGPPRRGPGRP